MLALHIIAAVVLGAAMGWWPLASVVRANLKTTAVWADHERMLRIACAASTGILWGLLLWRITATGVAFVVLAPLLVFSAASVVLAIVDLAEKRLPNAIIGPALVAVAMLLVVASALAGSWWNLLWALAGCAGMFVLYLLIALIPGAMGMGDVKLAALIGLTLGWFGLGMWLVGVFAGFVVGGVAAFVVLIRQRFRGRGRTIPYGPAILAGAAIALILLSPN